MINSSKKCYREVNMKQQKSQEKKWNEKREVPEEAYRKIR